MMTNKKEILKYNGFQFELKKDRICIKLRAPSMR